MNTYCAIYRTFIGEFESICLIYVDKYVEICEGYNVPHNDSLSQL